MTTIRKLSQFQGLFFILFSRMRTKINQTMILSFIVYWEIMNPRKLF